MTSQHPADILRRADELVAALAETGELAGARVLLVERYGYLGGMASSGEVHPFMSNHVDNCSRA